MVKHFCDSCGDEVRRNLVTNRYRPIIQIGQRTIKAEVLIAVDGVWNSGDLCLKCLRDLLIQTTEDHRFKEENEAIAASEKS